jgi:hypothetical protein
LFYWLLQTADIEVSVLVDKETAQMLNQGKESLTDILVLRIENFNDFYINIGCAYDRSCYGMHMEELATITGPVRQTSLPAIGELIGKEETPAGTGASAAGGAKLHVPKELWRLVDALWAGRALKEKDLFEIVMEKTVNSGPLISDAGLVAPVTQRSDSLEVCSMLLYGCLSC